MRPFGKISRDVIDRSILLSMLVDVVIDGFIIAYNDVFISIGMVMDECPTDRNRISV